MGRAGGMRGGAVRFARRAAGPILAVALVLLGAAGCSGGASSRVRAATGDGGGRTPSDLARLVPEGVVPAGPVERYDAATLFEKIDGKANVYFAAGFAGLACRRFRDAGRGGADAEVCAYRMTDPQAAWSVYGEQRPRGARDLGTVPDACEADDVTLLARGRDFVEITGGRDAGMRRRLVEAFVAASEEPPWDRPRPPFPAPGRLPDGDRLLRRNGFGFSGLDDVFVARYRIRGAEATAFWSRRASEADARRLASAYGDHLRASGAVPLAVDVGLPGADVLDVYGSIEVIAASGRDLAGVHQADSVEAARALASGLREAIEASAR